MRFEGVARFRSPREADRKPLCAESPGSSSLRKRAPLPSPVDIRRPENPQPSLKGSSRSEPSPIFSGHRIAEKKRRENSEEPPFSEESFSGRPGSDIAPSPPRFRPHPRTARPRALNRRADNRPTGRKKGKTHQEGCPAGAAPRAVECVTAVEQGRGDGRPAREERGGRAIRAAFDAVVVAGPRRAAVGRVVAVPSFLHLFPCSVSLSPCYPSTPVALFARLSPSLLLPTSSYKPEAQLPPLLCSRRFCLISTKCCESRALGALDPSVHLALKIWPV